MVKRDLGFKITPAPALIPSDAIVQFAATAGSKARVVAIENRVAVIQFNHEAIIKAVVTIDRDSWQYRILICQPFSDYLIVLSLDEVIPMLGFIASRGATL